LMYPRFENMNRRILALDDEHPAKKFLTAFIDCRENCVGREIDFGDGEPPVEQDWISTTDGRRWTFSGFAYAFISLEFELDAFATGAPFLYRSERRPRPTLPMLRQLMTECAQAARESDNQEIVELTDMIQNMFDLWEQYAAFRDSAASRPPR
jgi:hypothetical protein